MLLTGLRLPDPVATSTMSTARNTNTSSTVYRRPARVARVISPSLRHLLRSRSTVKADSPFQLILFQQNKQKTQSTKSGHSGVTHRFPRCDINEAKFPPSPLLPDIFFYRKESWPSLTPLNEKGLYRSLFFLTENIQVTAQSFLRQKKLTVESPNGYLYLFPGYIHFIRPASFWSCVFALFFFFKQKKQLYILTLVVGNLIDKFLWDNDPADGFIFS